MRSGRSIVRDPDQSIGFLLSDVARLLRRNFTRRAQYLGLSQAQWQALAHLARREGVNQATLAESLEIQPVTLARLVDRLQEKGLVERRPDPADRRAFCLYLTPAAAPLLDRKRTSL